MEKKNTQNVSTHDTRKMFDSLEFFLEGVLQNWAPSQVARLLDRLTEYLRSSGQNVPMIAQTPYINTIPKEEEPEYPGSRQIERKIKSYIRWNAMAMVVKANRLHKDIGGHISTYASCATLYEVAFNHFFRGNNNGERLADLVYFQGHASPGIYARAYLEGRLKALRLHAFRQDLNSNGGLSSYPHPYLMPDFWQFPTVSMGLSPLTSIYQARFIRYLKARGFLKKEEPRVWCFIGDGESDEPESLGAISLAGRENLDNLIWVINCNLQRLDGPVRGNGKIIQELEGMFRGAGWNVIKIIWGSDWDELLAKDQSGLLVKRMEEALDGDYQKYSVAPGSYTRKHFFGKYPELLELVNHMTDEQIAHLGRGGHDAQKVYAAYKKACEQNGRPTVILAKTIKGYGLGEAGEGRNITHQQKKLNEKELREFKVRFTVPIPDEEVVDAPFYRPKEDSEEYRYLVERRKALGGFLPERKVTAVPIEIPSLDYFEEFLKGTGKLEQATTMTFVRILTKLMGDENFGSQVVPIIPDEARTFGMDTLFRQFGIYAPRGQLYDPVDKENFLYYQESKDGQILEEGITEAGSLASFIAAGTSYANFGITMMPFFVFYSMFGFQRVGDLIWQAADNRTKGFLLGATAGRTTLSGEGLQHQDGHSHLIASTVPTLICYDPAFAYEVAVIIHDGMKRMYQNNEEIFYYITLYNEKCTMPAIPPEDNIHEGILRGLYKFKKGKLSKKSKAHIFASGPIMQEALKAQEILESSYSVSTDVWSATSYKQLRADALNVERWNMLHPDKTPKKSYIEKLLEKEKGVFVAVSDYMKLVPDQITHWVPGGLFTLGTDGFGRSDTRSNLRRFFEIDTESIVIAALYSLFKKEEIPESVVTQAIKDLKVYPEKGFPELI